ncbi:MAG: hypothetical protein EAX91_17555 [Candidatus Lokiarchaeota archaeon]|nr:hypothetical protein [Candidatus Lokiarchaeota archaeon]
MNYKLNFKVSCISKCIFCGKEAKVRGSMGDFCMECYKERFQDNYTLTDAPSFDDSGLKIMARKKNLK